jgi:probable HAF family extracellular repeat protein
MANRSNSVTRTFCALAVALAVALSAMASPALAAPPPGPDAEAPAAPTLLPYVRDKEGEYTRVRVPGASFVKPGGINNRGDFVGVGYPSEVGNDGGFGFRRDRRGRTTTFRVPGTVPESRTVAADINDRGHIAGWSDDERRSFGFTRRPDGTFARVEHPDARGTIPDASGGEIGGTELRGINDRGDVAGNYAADGTIHGFVRDRRGRYTTIRRPGAAATLVTAINDRGDVVGSYSTIGPEDLLVGAPRSFVYRDGVFRDITVADAVAVFVNGIDDRGRTAGVYLAADGSTHGFVRSRSGDVEVVDHPDADGLGTAVYSLNDRGELTGVYLGVDEPEDRPCDSTEGRRLMPGGMQMRERPGRRAPTDCAGADDPSVGFVLDHGRIHRIDLPADGGFTVLSKFDDRGRIVGKTPDEDGDGFDGLVGDRRGGLRRFEAPGATSTYAQGINERGWIVGDSSPGPSVTSPGATGYLLIGGRYTRIAYPRAVFTQAFDVNNRGQVVGEYLDQNGVYHGYRWQDGRFTSFDGPRGTGASFTGINDSGDIVGAYPVDPADPMAGLRGFVLRGDDYTTFAFPDAKFTAPFDINNRGQVVGVTVGDPALTEFHGFVYTRGVERPATQIDIPGAAATSVFGIDDRGRLLGVYDNPPAAPGTRDRGTTPIDTMPMDGMPMGLGQSGNSG